MAPDADDSTIDLRLQLASGADPVAGLLLDGDGHETGFEGYVELIAAIERLLAHDRQPH